MSHSTFQTRFKIPEKIRTVLTMKIKSCFQCNTEIKEDYMKKEIAETTQTVFSEFVGREKILLVVLKCSYILSFSLLYL